MNELSNPTIVDFPLRGEWSVPNTPGKVIPSHGTDLLGQRYAYDFMMIDWSRKDNPFYRGSNLRYYAMGVKLEECYGWGQEVYAPCDGKIVTVKDGVSERSRVHLVRDVLVLLKNALLFNPKKHDIKKVTGNHIIIKSGEEIYAFLAHFQTGSIRVSEGQDIKKGELLGRVGHSGNSTAPHLHFHLMDSPDLYTAKGIPCAFNQYKVFKDGIWNLVKNGIPSDKERICY
jgi:murein DD-endopeptidase MepM/ murein hydrolase activator NlpD